jgi:hypothetical protein
MVETSTAHLGFRCIVRVETPLAEIAKVTPGG